MCLFKLCQKSWREPIAEVSERATNDNSAREIKIYNDDIIEWCDMIDITGW
jgi:hypothetical protein